MDRYIHHKHFWSRDLSEILKEAISGVWTLMLALFMFVMLGLPVIIPGVLMWVTQLITGWP